MPAPRKERPVTAGNMTPEPTHRRAPMLAAWPACILVTLALALLIMAGAASPARAAELMQGQVPIPEAMKSAPQERSTDAGPDGTPKQVPPTTRENTDDIPGGPQGYAPPDSGADTPDTSNAPRQNSEDTPHQNETDRETDGEAEDDGQGSRGNGCRFDPEQLERMREMFMS